MNHCGNEIMEWWVGRTFFPSLSYSLVKMLNDSNCMWMALSVISE